MLATRTEAFVGGTYLQNRSGGGLGRKEKRPTPVSRGQGIRVLVTIDQGFEYQQNLGDRKIALLLLVAPSNQLEDLAPLIPSVLAVLHTIQPGSVIRVGTG